ncbi:MAG: DNA methyltransferase [Candidatus Thorarchaeota archaeon]
MSSSIKINKPLKINNNKTCECKDNHINCLSAKEWMKNQVAVWEFYYEKRDLRNKDLHPAVFPISLPAKCIELFTHKGELVLDPFAGSGTTLLAAQDLDRNAVGFDLKQEYVELSDSRLVQTRLEGTSQQIAICDDAFNIPEYFLDETISLCITSPPYSNMLNRPRKNKSMRGDLRQNDQYLKVQQYSNDSRDLGTMKPEKYARKLGEIYSGILPLLQPKAHCIINIADLWWENKRITLPIYVIESMRKVGYELRNTIIWDRRNIVNRAGIFGWPNNYITLSTTFEYILDFWKPP